MKPIERFLSWRQVTSMTALSRAHVRRLIGRGEFPAPICVSERNRVWRLSEVQGWCRDRVAERDRLAQRNRVAPPGRRMSGRPPKLPPGASPPDPLDDESPRRRRKAEAPAAAEPEAIAKPSRGKAEPAAAVEPERNRAEPAAIVEGRDARRREKRRRAALAKHRRAVRGGKTAAEAPAAERPPVLHDLRPDLQRRLAQRERERDGLLLEE